MWWEFTSYLNRNTNDHNEKASCGGRKEGGGWEKKTFYVYMSAHLTFLEGGMTKSEIKLK